jgi:WD40 repeat protein
MAAPKTTQSKSTSKSKSKSKTKPERRIIAAWDGVSSFACGPKGWIVAGENGGYRLCAWDPSGRLAWEEKLASSGPDSRYQFETKVCIVGAPSHPTVLALMKYDAKLYAFDLETGKPRGEHAIAQARAFALTPDEETIVLRTGTDTTLCAWPSLDGIAKFGEYCNQNVIAISRDGRWLAVAGHEIHVYDLPARRHVKTWAPEQGPWDMIFSADGERLLTGDRKNMLSVYEAGLGWKLVKAVGRGRAPTITALAASPDGRFVAAALDTGTVVVHDTATLDVIAELKGHDPSQPDTGARTIAQVGFDAEGRLVVSAPPKKEPAGLTLHRL